MASGLTNADFEAADGTGGAGWGDDTGLGYQRVLQVPARYNYVAYLQVPESTPVAPRTASAYQGVELTPVQSQPKSVFVGAMVKGSGIVADADGGGAFRQVIFQVDCTAAPGFRSYAPGGTPWCPDGALWCSSLRSVGTFDWRWIGVDSHSCGVGYLDATGRWVPVPIKSVGVSVLLNGATGAAWFDVIQLKEYDAGAGAVTLMFDDGFRSAFDTALPILSNASHVGSSSVISDEVGDYRSLTPENLQALQSAGWDMSSHSVDHPSMGSLTTAAAKTQRINSKSALESYGVTVDSFTWPFGDDSADLIGLTESLGNPTPLYRSTRTVGIDDNAHGSNLCLLKGFEIDKPTTLDQVKIWIRKPKDEPSYTSACTGWWGIFRMHDVTEDPGDYDTTPALLRSVVDEVKQSGLDVINYRTGHQRFANVPMP